MSELGPIQNRWGPALRQGFVVVPVVLLRKQASLGIDNSELTVLLNLLSQWHSDESPVWLSYSVLAGNMGVSERTVQRSVASLSDKKFIEVLRSDAGRIVKFEGLLQRLSFSFSFSFQLAASGDLTSP